MNRTKIFSRTGTIIAAVAIAACLVAGGCDGWGVAGDRGNDRVSKTVKVGEVFTLNQNGSAKLVDANGADLDLSVHLEGWMICPKDADCEVQNHVIWSVKAGGETIRPSYMLHDGCVCVIELPPYKIEMTGTDWKRQASFKIVRSSVDPDVDCRNVDVDARDGCIGTPPPPNPAGRTVKIGNLTWMAENLNVATVNNATDSSWCHGNDDSNCAKYGRLYNWNAAMKACPAGWRLPDTADWNDLARAVGGVQKIYDISDYYGIHSGYWDAAGKKLKSKTGWSGTMHTQVENVTVPAVESTDDYGFTALPGGVRSYGHFNGTGYNGYWWTATETPGRGINCIRIFDEHGNLVSEDCDPNYDYNKGAAWHRTMDGNGNRVYDQHDYKRYGMSVRCVK